MLLKQGLSSHFLITDMVASFLYSKCTKGLITECVENMVSSFLLLDELFVAFEFFAAGFSVKLFLS